MDDYTSADAVLILVSNVRLIGSPKQRRPGMEEKAGATSASPARYRAGSPAAEENLARLLQARVAAHLAQNTQAATT